MRLRRIPPRPDHQLANRHHMLTFDESVTRDGTARPYWLEGTFVELSDAEAAELKQAGERLFQAYCEATEHVLAACPQRADVMSRRTPDPAACTSKTCLMSMMDIPAWAHEGVIVSWENDFDPDLGEQSLTGDYTVMLYGRFDLAYGGDGPPKLYEYNADTPTCLIEAALVQWHWWLDVPWERPTRQPNVIHDALVNAWKYKLGRLAAARPHLGPAPLIHFVYYQAPYTGEVNPSEEDMQTTRYLAETATQAGFPVTVLPIQEVVHDLTDDRFYDPSGRPIQICFGLYPKEWMLDEPNGKALARHARRLDGVTWIEPLYKVLWTNKGMLPVLWRLFPDHPNLLPAYVEGKQPPEFTAYARKPVLGREGANIRLVQDGQTLDSNDGPYDGGRYVLQALRVAPEVGDAQHLVWGVWTVLDEVVGFGARLTAAGDGHIVNGESHFVPFVVTGE